MEVRFSIWGEKQRDWSRSLKLPPAFGIAVTVGMCFHQEGKSDWAPHTITEPHMGTPPGKHLKSRRRRRRRLVYFTMIMKRAFALWPNEKRFFKKKNNTYCLVV